MSRKAAVAALSLITLLSGCAVSNVNTRPGPAPEAVQNTSGVIPQDRILHSYMMQVNQIIAGQVGRIRAEQERAAMKQAGHPVTLPTGACRAVAVILANGTVVRAELAGCASEALGKIELAAIHAASPLPPTPFGHNASITIETVAPDATPGVGGQ
ncbi:hypothetical protein HF289_14665 [Acidithiobacillus ferrooxidans]|uniref:hypothetical protein n=1 Tax=Acidithiobacillus ferrooxidans TaxID=920 RepID=UPI000A443A9D|nr:hypothetical protein [Acidithiobacillus ferrooxidans]MBU2858046.1 hypothetical protein [Acidithiobacillus ferrooxidans]MBU2862168.1 hypothetical protein [Acidithiobacillus ferrooxidans]MCR2832268.1 hypothetical protein [Acidithiobacillus ferrooxidans]